MRHCTRCLCAADTVVYIRPPCKAAFIGQIKLPSLGLNLCCHNYEMLSTLLNKGPCILFCTGPYKLDSWSCPHFFGINSVVSLQQVIKSDFLQEEYYWTYKSQSVLLSFSLHTPPWWLMKWVNDYFFLFSRSSLHRIWELTYLTTGDGQKTTN